MNGKQSRNKLMKSTIVIGAGVLVLAICMQLTMRGGEWSCKFVVAMYVHFISELVPEFTQVSEPKIRGDFVLLSDRPH